jgi:hypothetical protein
MTLAELVYCILAATICAALLGYGAGLALYDIVDPVRERWARARERKRWGLR